MKNLKLKPSSLLLEELTAKISNHFSVKYTVTDNGINEIIVARDKNIGCKLVLTNKRLFIAGTFPSKGSLLLAFSILILGAVIIPMAIYLVAFKGKFDAIENELQEYVQSEFDDRLVK